MAIDNIKGLPPARVQNDGGDGRVKARSDESRTASRREESPSSTADTVSFTDAARRLRELEKSVAGLPVVDAQRVDAVKKSLEDGAYQVRPERVADKLVSFEGALTGKLSNR
jgi:negative regulator of flagellin synthesis FlgM